MIRDSIQTLGQLNILLQDENGNIVYDKTVPNLVVQTGRNYIAHRMTSNSNVFMSHMAIGTGTNSPANADTTLQIEEARVALTSGVTTANIVTYTATFSPGTPATAKAITEAGIFNANSGGEMLCRTKFDVINKGVLDTMTVTWTVSNS